MEQRSNITFGNYYVCLCKQHQKNMISNKIRRSWVTYRKKGMEIAAGFITTISVHVGGYLGIIDTYHLSYIKDLFDVADVFLSEIVTWNPPFDAIVENHQSACVVNLDHNSRKLIVDRDLFVIRQAFI